MNVTLDLYQLKNLCMDMASLGAANFVKETQPVKDLISQREAYRQFGEARVKRWKQEQRICHERNGQQRNSKLLYSRAELMAVDKSEKLNQYINY